MVMCTLNNLLVFQSPNTRRLPEMTNWLKPLLAGLKSAVAQRKFLSKTMFVI